MVPTPRFAINGQLDTPPFGMSHSGGLCKKLPHDLFHLLRFYAMTQHAAPRAVMWHALAFELEYLTEFLCSQFGPMGHPTAAILTRQLRQPGDHEQASPRIAHPTSMTMIGNRL